MGKKENDEVNMVKKVLGFLPGLLYNILTIFCVVLIAIIVMQRFTDSNQSIGGYKIFKVVSGSMVPKYDIGEVVISKETPMEDIKVGNAIVYRGKLGELNGKIVMHEVVAINQDENNELKFYAKGLNNSKGDPEISESQILGVVKVRSSILTLLYKLATNIYSLFIIITILVINVFVSFRGDKEQEIAEKNARRKNKKVDKEKKEIIEGNSSQNSQDLQNEIQNLKKEIEELKSQESIYQTDIEKNQIDNHDAYIKNKDIEKKVEEKAESKGVSKNVTKRKTTKKTVSNKEDIKKEENVVIDTKKESAKIENVEDSKDTEKVVKKSTTKKETEKVTNKTSKKTEVENSTKTKVKAKKE